jgi:hypothetical protein
VWNQVYFIAITVKRKLKIPSLIILFSLLLENAPNAIQDKKKEAD